MALVKSGWGLVAIAIGAVVGGLIDATNFYKEATDAIDDNTDALERNSRKTADLRDAREEMLKIKNVEKLKAEKKALEENLGVVSKRQAIEQKFVMMLKDTGHSIDDLVKDDKLLAKTIKSVIKEQEDWIKQSNQLTSATEDLDNQFVIVMDDIEGFDKHVSDLKDQLQAFIAMEQMTGEQLKELTGLTEDEIDVIKRR